MNDLTELTALAASTRATLARIATEFSPAVFASSLAAEDMVITDMILKAGLPIEIFSLDTGRLHPETLAVLDQVKATYAYEIALFKPHDAAVADCARRWPVIQARLPASARPSGSTLRMRQHSLRMSTLS